jgi:hypothetical protein
MGKNKRKLKSSAPAKPAPLPVKIIFNYAFLIVLSGAIAFVFLPMPIHRYLDGIVWEYPLTRRFWNFSHGFLSDRQPPDHCCPVFRTD